MADYVPLYEGKQELALTELRDRLYKRDGLIQYATVGYFLQWFGAVEMHLDRMLCWCSGQRDFASFGDLIKGMAPRVKLERLRRIWKRSNITVGPNLAARLKHFEGPILTVRNNIAHCFIIHDQEADMIKLSSLHHIATNAKHTGIHAMPTLTLFEHGVFLHLLSMDMKQLLDHNTLEVRDLALEIVDPTSSLPKANPPATPQLEAPANVDTPTPVAQE